MDLKDKYLVIAKSSDGLERNVLVDKNISMSMEDLVEYIKKETMIYFSGEDSVISAEIRFVMPKPIEDGYAELREIAKLYCSPESGSINCDVIESYSGDSRDESPWTIFDWVGSIDENDPNSHREFCELVQFTLNNRGQKLISKMLEGSEFVKVINELGLTESKLWSNYESRLFISEDEKRLLKTIIDWRNNYYASLGDDE